MFGCLHAWDNQGNVVVCYALELHPILDVVSWLSWMPLIRVNVFLKQFTH